MEVLYGNDKTLNTAPSGFAPLHPLGVPRETLIDGSHRVASEGAVIYLAAHATSIWVLMARMLGHGKVIIMPLERV